MPNFEINISIPISSNSISEVARATAPFIVELEALKQKLPDNASYKDGLTGLRTGAPGSRKSLAQRIEEGVAAEMARRLSPATAQENQPNGETRRVPRGALAG
jgi:hypothetical protein